MKTTSDKNTPHLLFSRDSDTGTWCICGECGEEINVENKEVCPECGKELVYYDGYSW